MPRKTSPIPSGPKAGTLKENPPHANSVAAPPLEDAHSVAAPPLEDAHSGALLPKQGGDNSIHPAMLSGAPVMAAYEVALKDALARARMQGRYMVVVFRLEPVQGQNDKLYMDLITKNFPRGDYNECLRLFQETLLRDVSQSQASKSG